MSRLDELLDRYGGRSAGDARSAVTEIAEAYSARAKNIGYVPLVCAAIASGLAGVLLMARGENGSIDETKLPAELVEAFRMQYPNVYESGGLGTLTPESASGYLNGWSGKYTEILVRDRLNSGGSVGGLSLAPGETAVLAEDPTQAVWDMSIEPSGRLIQIKATDSVAYVRETMEDLDGTGIDVIATDLPSFDVDSSAQLMELDQSKDEIDSFLDAAIEDSIDGFGLDDVLGPLALLFTAGTTALIVKKVRDDLKNGASAKDLYRTYGPGVVGKAINLASPVPFTGFVAARWLRTRVLLSEAADTVALRVKRANSMLSWMRSAGMVVPD
jgi:hypothetical protein